MAGYESHENYSRDGHNDLFADGGFVDGLWLVNGHGIDLNCTHSHTLLKVGRSIIVLTEKIQCYIDRVNRKNCLYGQKKGLNGNEIRIHRSFLSLRDVPEASLVMSIKCS